MTLFRPGGRCSVCGNDPAEISGVLHCFVCDHIQQLGAASLDELSELVALGKILKKFFADKENWLWIKKSKQFGIQACLDGRIDLTPEEADLLDKWEHVV